MGRPRKASVGLPVHVHVVRARGHDYYYYQQGRGARLKGPRVKLPAAPFEADGTPSSSWWTAYRRCAGEGDTGPRPGSVSALVLSYKASAEWQAMSERSQGERIRHLKRIETVWGDLMVAGIEPWHVVELRDMHAKTPGEANNVIRQRLGRHVVGRVDVSRASSALAHRPVLHSSRDGATVHEPRSRREQSG